MADKTVDAVVIHLLDGPHKLKVPTFWALDMALKYGIDLTDPNDIEVANFSTILAALLTDSAGVDAAFAPVRWWFPIEVALSMLPESTADYDAAIAGLLKAMTAEIKARKAANRPNSPAAASSRGGKKPSPSPETSQT